MNKEAAVEVTSRLGEAYRAWKSSEKEKDEYRKRFFELADEALEGTTVLERVEVEAESAEEALAQVEKRFPQWRVQDIRSLNNGWFQVIIEEDPSLRPYQFVNPDDGQVYSRQVSSGTMHLDEERLQADDPELFEAVTYIPQERQLRSLEELEPEQVARLQEYLYEGRPRVKLAPPREAKPEEVAASNLERVVERVPSE